MDQNPFSKVTADDEAKNIQDDYHTCPSSISNVIRKDLPAEAKCIIKQKLDGSMTRISNYISQFASIVYMIITELRNCVFDMDHNTGKLKLTSSPDLILQAYYQLTSPADIIDTYNLQRLQYPKISLIRLFFFFNPRFQSVIWKPVFGIDSQLLFWNKRF